MCIVGRLTWRRRTRARGSRWSGASDEYRGQVGGFVEDKQLERRLEAEVGHGNPDFDPFEVAIIDGPFFD